VDPVNDASRALKHQLIVIKVGSALLVDSESGLLRREWLRRLCGDIAALRHEGHSVVIVSSGAIALGRRTLRLKPGALKLEESQAAAAVGQVRLAEAYVEALPRRISSRRRSCSRWATRKGVTIK